jgi:AraC-like DNA-binding protein
MAPHTLDLRRTPPHILYANFYPFQPRETGGPQWARSIHVIMVTHGEGRIDAGGSSYPLAPGQALVVPWTMPLYYVSAPRQPFAISTIHLAFLPWNEDSPCSIPQGGGATMSHGAMEAPPYGQSFDRALFIPNAAELGMLDRAASIIAAFEEQWGARRDRLLRALAILLLDDVDRAREHVPQGSGHPRSLAVRELISYMRAAYRRRITRAELARRVDMSQSALATAFRAVAGTSPIEFLIELRMQHARRLLATGRDPVAKVADLVGMGDTHHFCRLFKARVGTTPLQYRKRQWRSAPAHATVSG